MALSKTTQDHNEIQQWAEARGAIPAEVASTESKGQTGILRLEFPGAKNANDSALKEISWDEFFEKFDASGLALVYQEQTAEGEQSNFNKLIYPEEPQAKPAKKTPAKKTAAKKTAAKKTAATKTAAKKTAAKKTTAARAASRSTPAKKSAGAKSTKKAVASKSAKTPAKKAAKKPPAAAKKSPTAATKVPARKSAGKKASGTRSRNR